MFRLSRNLGASTSWNPEGLSRPVMGLLYLFICKTGAGLDEPISRLGYGLDDREIVVRFPPRTRGFFFLQMIHTGSEYNPVSYVMSSGNSFSGGKTAGA
jgi:hypothetical protein